MTVRQDKNGSALCDVLLFEVFLSFCCLGRYMGGINVSARLLMLQVAEVSRSQHTYELPTFITREIEDRGERGLHHADIRISMVTTSVKNL